MSQNIKENQSFQKKSKSLETRTSHKPSRCTQCISSPRSDLKPFDFSVFCKSCQNFQKIEKFLSKLIQEDNCHLNDSLNTTKEKLLKSSQKLTSRLSDVETVLNKIKQSSKFTCESLNDYSESRSELHMSKLNLKHELQSTQAEIKSLQSDYLQLKQEENRLISQVDYERSSSMVLKKELVKLRSDLASLQDKNFEKIRRIEEIRLEIRDFHNRNLGRKKTKLKGMITDDFKQLVRIREENEKIGEIINLTEESSRTGSMITCEEVSTNHEDEESLKEYAEKLQQQQARIWRLKLELEQKNEINAESCKCLVM